jgi:haloalkane dehalogenase
MVPTRLEHPTVQPLEEVNDWAGKFTGPVRLVWGIRDPIMGRALRSMRRLFPKAEVVETDAGHFLQEEVPDVLSEAILQVVSEQRQK